MSESSGSSGGLWMASPTPIRRPFGDFGNTILGLHNIALNTPATPPRRVAAPELGASPVQGFVRSFSAPDMTRNMTDTGHSSIGSQGGLNSPAGAALGPNTQAETRNSTSSVRHLTCFWWKEKGSCRLSDDECLYAHYDTGHYTDPPRQVIPGEPAMAGRRLDRAMRGLIVPTPRSAVSLNNLGGSRYGTRNDTAGVQANTGAGTNSYASSYLSPLSLPPQPNLEHDLTRLNNDLTRLNNDNQFLRTIVDQNGREKAILVSTIEALQENSKAMKGELEGLRNAQEQLLAEREGLHMRIQQLEGGQVQGIAGARGVSNPFGTIGRARVNTETRYLGGLLTEE